MLYLGGIGPPPISVGQHTVVAEYNSPKHGLLKSDPIGLTVLKKTPTLTVGYI